MVASVDGWIATKAQAIADSFRMAHDFEDLKQEGRIAAFGAARRFRADLCVSTRRNPFLAYADKRIFGAMVRYAIEQCQAVRVPEKTFGEKGGVHTTSLDALEPWQIAGILGPDGVVDGRAPIEARDRAATIAAAIEGLSPKHAQVIRRLYYSGEKLREIAHEKGVSPQRIQQTAAAALQLLRKRLANRL